MPKRTAWLLLLLPSATACPAARSPTAPAAPAPTAMLDVPDDAFDDLAQREWGFTPGRDLGDARAQAGIDHVFAGDAFRLRIPVQVFRRQAERGLLDISPRSLWMVYGNPPSPASRGTRGDPRQKAGLGLSVFRPAGMKNPYLNFNCFACHAGVVAGQLVAGVGNAHVDHYAQAQQLYIFDDVSDGYKELTKAEPTADTFRSYLRSAQMSVQKKLVDSALGAEFGVTGPQVDEAMAHLRWFDNYAETILGPALGNASSRGDNLGPFPVWKLIARMADPATRGFTVVDNLDPVPLDTVIAHRLEAVHRLRPTADDTGRPMAALLDEYLVDHPPAPRAPTRRDALWRMPPVDPAPWWQRKYKTKSYWYLDTLATAEGARDFAINFHVPHQDANADFRRHAAVIGTVLHAAARMQSPPYPHLDDVDWTKVESGRRYYNRRCAQCHGTVKRRRGHRKTAPRWVLHYRDLKDEAGQPLRPDCDIVDVGTDPVYSDVLKAFMPLVDKANQLQRYFAADGPGAAHGVPADQRPAGHNTAEDGYMAPPLVGIWASAPYLHNGSVPTLRALLAKPPGQRPVVWGRSLHPAHYDWHDVGLVYDQVPADAIPPKPRVLVDVLKADPTFATPEAIAHRRYYNTRDFGKSNRGHGFLVPTDRTCGGKALDVGERDGSCIESVLEFLRVLGDERVVPDQARHPDCPDNYG